MSETDFQGVPPEHHDAEVAAAEPGGPAVAADEGQTAPDDPEGSSGNFTGPPVVELTAEREAELAAEAEAERLREQEGVPTLQSEAQKAKAERRAEAAKAREEFMAERAKAREERAAAHDEAQPE